MGKKCISCGCELIDYEDFCSQCGSCQNSTEDNNRVWYYIYLNERKGIYSDTEIVNLIRSGVISRDTLIWRNGIDNWVKASNSIFQSQFAFSVPPVPVNELSDRMAWTLATVPIGVSILLTSVVGHAAIWITVVTIILNCIFLIMDIKELRKSGQNVDNWIYLGFLLVPVYLFIRASKTNKKYGYPIVWCVLFTISIISI